MGIFQPVELLFLTQMASQGPPQMPPHQVELRGGIQAGSHGRKSICNNCSAFVFTHIYIYMYVRGFMILVICVRAHSLSCRHVGAEIKLDSEEPKHIRL